MLSEIPELAEIALLKKRGRNFSSAVWRESLDKVLGEYAELKYLSKCEALISSFVFLL